MAEFVMVKLAKTKADALTKARSIKKRGFSARIERQGKFYRVEISTVKQAKPTIVDTS